MASVIARLIALALLAAACALAQTITGKPAAGKFLVASRELPDPNFAQSVVLLIQYDAKGAMGLIINRETKVPLSRVFENPKSPSQKLYFGGPVQVSGALALLRSATKIEEAKHVLEDVYMVTDKAVLEKQLAAGADAKTLRIYLGYSGWAPGQLDHELELGAWHVLPGDAPTVFDPNPDSVWMKLIRRTELRLAGLSVGAEGDTIKPCWHAFFDAATCLEALPGWPLSPPCAGRWPARP